MADAAALLGGLAQGATEIVGMVAHNYARGGESWDDPGYANHFGNGEREITRAINGLSGTAVFLGAGACQEIPLKKIAEVFNRVILVDVDTQYSARAVGKIPEHLQGRIELRQFDLTGVFEQFSQTIEAMVEGKLKPATPGEFLAQVLQLLPQIERKAFTLDEKVSFISSSLVCSQLTGIIGVWFNAICQKYYGQGFQEEDIAPITDWFSQIQRGHIADIANLAAPHATIYFADHFSFQVFESGVPVSDTPRRVLPESLSVKDELNTRFNLSRLKSWNWHVLCDVGVKRFYVNALTLHPKA